MIAGMVELLAAVRAATVGLDLVEHAHERPGGGLLRVEGHDGPPQGHDHLCPLDAHVGHQGLGDPVSARLGSFTYLDVDAAVTHPHATPTRTGHRAQGRCHAPCAAEQPHLRFLSIAPTTISDRVRPADERSVNAA